MINGDHDRISQVLSNLLNNASKYSPEGTPIEVSVLRNGSSLTVTVSDRGPGFPAQERHKLFEMFYRPNIEITRRVSGTGIGLHISKQIIDAHGGSIDLALRPGGGTIASFRIPIIR
jgi:two-component system sensor histidine kinase KdpD